MSWTWRGKGFLCHSKSRHLFDSETEVNTIQKYAGRPLTKSEKRTIRRSNREGAYAADYSNDALKKEMIQIIRSNKDSLKKIIDAGKWFDFSLKIRDYGESLDKKYPNSDGYIAVGLDSKKTEPLKYPGSDNYWEDVALRAIYG